VSEFFGQTGPAEVVPVLVVDDPAAAPALAAALVDGGITTVEVTLRTERALEVITALKANPRLRVGAGTVLNEGDARSAHLAGASFVVSPGLDEGTVEFCNRHKLPVIPGIATPTEAQRALNLGLRTVKVFPVDHLGGRSYLDALSSPLALLSFFPSGGIGAENVAEYASSAAVTAVGSGWVAPRALVQQGDFEEVSRRCAAIVAAAGTGSA
jgi:2-dehydro-3-deoxyphosphogluconate aldolase / (4S)-4-hydroxy-2-oxoglutarate aldolase